MNVMSENNAPYISVIMGVYNNENTIEKCIDSVEAQTFSDWEFIICDDGSEDATYEILKRRSDADPRIKLVRNINNMHLALSLNRCLARASGKYIARMDGDDECLPDRFETEAAFLDRYPEYAAVGSGCFIVSDRGCEGIRLYRERPDASVMLCSNPFCHPSIMMRSEVYRALGGYRVSKETTRAEDLDLWFRFFENGYSGYNIQKPLIKRHISLLDYKKRTLKAAVMTSKVYLEGYRRLGFPVHKRILALKPVISALIPDKMISSYHRSKLK